LPTQQARGDFGARVFLGSGPGFLGVWSDASACRIRPFPEHNFAVAILVRRHG